MSIQIPEREYGSEEREVESDLEEEELEKLESDVKQMAEKILHYRQTLPSQLKEAFADLGSFHGASEDVNQGPLSGNSELAKRTALSEGDKQMEANVQLLKEKMLKNVANVPILSKRIKECISKIDNLDSNHRTIHPAFRRDRTIID